MPRPMLRAALALSSLLYAAASPSLLLERTRADDWPQWMGPNRDANWRESGIVEKFPEGGPKIAWRAPVGLGYAGPAVADGRVYVADFVKKEGTITNNPGTRDRLVGEERLLCLDSATGEELWKYVRPREYALSYPAGPRCTPTVDGDLVFMLGAEGDLACLKTADGSVVWEKSLTREYGIESPIWGFAAHPLVRGDLLYCVVGGEGSVAVAFDKRTGKEVWRALSAPEPGYCPPTLIEQAGEDRLVIWHSESINALDPVSGEVLWTIPLRPNYGMAIAAPRQLGDLLVAGAIVDVGAAIRLNPTKPAAEVVWSANARRGVTGTNGTPYLEEGHIYGVGRDGALTAAKLSDGERLWTTFAATSGERPRNNATAFLVKQGDRFVLFNDQGELILANLTPEGYEEIDRAKVLDPTQSVNGLDVVWSHPAFAERACFARNDQEIVRVDLAADGE